MRFSLLNTGKLLAATLAVLFCCTQVALAGSGGAAPDESSKSDSSKSGGSAVGGKTKKRRAVRRTPVLAGFTLTSAALTDAAQMKLRYRITAPAKRVRVRAIVRTKGGTYIKTLELGVHRTNALVTTALSASEVGVSRAGSYKLRLTARDGKRRAAKRAKNVPAWRAFTFSDHRFPVDGPFSFGNDGARFGAGRPGHTHQGQDVIADSGTRIVAPYSGTVSYVAYQAGGAGYYVVLNADDRRDYVFMHLLKGSTAVEQGQRVRTGQRIGLVGATGQASGPHLHFEIWTGGAWQFGGKPVDPLPLLKSWFAGGPGNAVRTSSVASVAAFEGPLD